MGQKQTAKYKFKIRTGDSVRVMAGNSKGAEGKVVRILAEKSRAVVEGTNMIKKHVKPSAANPNGGIIEVEGSIHISNLALIDPKTGKPTRVGRKVVEVDGKKKIVRIAKKSGEEIQ